MWMPPSTHDLDTVIIPIDDVIDGEWDNRCLLRQILYRQVRIERKLNRMETKMSALSDAVDALVARVQGDTQHLLDLLAASQASEAAALANDAADQATIAAAQSERDAALADAQATVDRINSIDPVADFPAVEQPPVEPPVEPPA